MRRKWIFAISILLVCAFTLSACSQKFTPHHYREVTQYLNNYSLSAYSTTNSSNAYDKFPLTLKGKYKLMGDRKGIVSLHKDVVAGQSDRINTIRWEFYLKKYRDVEFTVTTYDNRHDNHFGYGYSLRTNYNEKAAAYILNEFVALSADAGLDSTKWRYDLCLYEDREELEKQAQFFLEYLDYLMDHALPVYLERFSFIYLDQVDDYDDANSYSILGAERIGVMIGIVDGRMAPVYKRAANSDQYPAYLADDDFPGGLLKKFDVRYGDSQNQD